MRLFSSLLLGFTLLVPAIASAQAVPRWSSTWRAAAQGGPDNPAGDPGYLVRPGQYLDDATWRGLDEHAQRYHFGLWTAEEVAALEQLPGVQLAVLTPVPGTSELGVVQWPDRVVRGAVFLVAIGNADPGTDWILRASGDAPESGAPPVDGPASSAVSPTSTGFFRVHRVVGGDSFRGRRTQFRAERVELNPLQLESELELTASAVTLRPEAGATGPVVLVAGTFTVRNDESATLPAPVVVNLSLQGPSADLFTLEVLPAAGEPALASARDVRVTDRVLFRILAPQAMVTPGTFVDRALPPGGTLLIRVQAEIVSFAGEGGDELDLGLSTRGFSVEPGVPVVFPPSRQAPLATVRRQLPLEIWRPIPVPSPPAPE